MNHLFGKRFSNDDASTKRKYTLDELSIEQRNNTWARFC